MLRFSNFLKNSFIHFRVLLYFVTCFLRVMVSLLCRLQAVSKMHVPIYPYLTIVKGDGIVLPRDRQCNKTVTLRKRLPNIKTC